MSSKKVILKKKGLNHVSRTDPRRATMREFSTLSIFIVSRQKNQAKANSPDLAKEYIGSTTQESAVAKMRSDGLHAVGINTVQSSEGSTGRHEEEWGRTRKCTVTSEQGQIKILRVKGYL